MPFTAFVVALTLATQTDAATADVAATVPVSVECSVAQPGTQLNAKLGIRPAYIDGVTVVLTNTRDIAATEVRVVIDYAGAMRTIVDRNTLPAGKKRKREFSIGDVVYTSESAGCRISGVTFADGTSYTPPSH